MKKKILSITLVVCLLATALVSGTLAYFTDTEGAKNVMTVGNVDIVQHEKDSEGNPFEDGQKMYPLVGDENWIDKIVTVENIGSEDAYVRTLIALQMLEVKDAQGNVIGYMDPADAFGTNALETRQVEGLCFKWNSKANGDSLYWPLNDKDGMENMKSVYASGKDYTHLDLNGKKYVVAAYYYYGTRDDYDNRGTATSWDSVLEAGETSHQSLMKVGLDSNVTNEQAKYFENYEILVVTQAVQTEGFTTDANGNGSICDDALNTAFGALETVDQATLQSWFANAQ